ncbi:MAG: hypothetical protein A2511_15710 [Deltaproteobacteria bacterium RIFOXYD12_FULL_50_9]|nr:MAG: hypothetical protein A2511_15710 [Deltaproteobacteria bacterium RIFOXYD12_FULL_50_9]
MKKQLFAAINLSLPAMFPAALTLMLKRANTRFSPTFLVALVATIYFFIAAGALAASLPQADRFTIKSIKADPSGNEVIIEFTEPFDRQLAINNLTITPPTVNYRPWESSMPSSVALRINGDFRRGTSYGIKFASGFMALSGRPFVESLKEFNVPHRSPKMDFIVPGSVIELNSRQLVHLAVVNVESVIVESQALSPLAYFAHQKGIESKLVNALPKGHPLGRYAGDGSTSRDLYDTKGKPDQEQNFSMPLANRQDKEKGALLFVTLKDNALGGAGSSKPTFFNVTDLAITCLAGGDDTLVWVTSIATGQPVAGAEIMAYTTFGSFFIAGKTDNDGILRIRSGKRKGYRFPTPASVAGPYAALYMADRSQTSGPETGIQAVDDLNYNPRDLKFLCARTDNDVAIIGSPDDGNWRLPFSGVRQTSNISETPRETRSVLFTERGVYRPGETVHFKAVTRFYQTGSIKPPMDERCSISVYNSREQPIYAVSLILGEFGSAAADLPLAASSPLGEYRADLNCGPSPVSTTFRVEEFKPPRHFSRLGFETVKRRDDSYVNRPADLDFLKVKIAGGYYAGGPVKNARVRWQLAYGPSSRTIEGYENYTFGHESPNSEPEPLESGETYLDGDGQIALDFPMSREVLAGEKALVVSATVLDFDGRAASVTKSWVAQAPYNVGISQHKPDIAAQSEQQLDAVVVDAAGKRIKTGRVEAEILRWGWTYLRKRNLEGNEYWTNERVWRRASINELALKNGTVSFGANFDWGGDYIVKFTYFAPDGKSYSSATRFDVGWYDPDEGGGNNRDHNALKVALYSDRLSYRPGQTATVRLGTKRKAVAYLTATGRQGLFDYHVSRPTDGLKEIKIPIAETHLPNVYATVIGTLARGGIPGLHRPSRRRNAKHPLRCHGFAGNQKRRGPVDQHCTGDQGAGSRTRPGSKLESFRHRRGWQGQPGRAGRGCG